MMTQFRKFRKSLVKTRRSSRIVENLEKSLRPIADRFHAYTGSDMHLLVNFYMAYIFYLNFFLALSFCLFCRCFFLQFLAHFLLHFCNGFTFFGPFLKGFLFRVAKCHRYGRYICVKISTSWGKKFVGIQNR